MLRAVSPIHICDRWHQRIVWVWIAKQRADGEQHFGAGEGWAPLVLQDVEADAAILVNVAVVEFGGEIYFGRLEGIVGWEVNV